MSERRELVELLIGAGHAHHAVFEEADGFDPEWPLWYAEHLREPIEKVLGVDLTVSELVYLLVGAAREHREQDGPWAEFYADRIIEAIR